MTRQARGGLIAGLLLVLAGAGWLLETTGVLDLGVEVWIGLLLIAVGLAIALDAGHSHGFLVTLGVLLVLVGIPAAAIDADFLADGVGDRRETPTSVSETDDPYRLGMGQLVLDLTELTAIGDVEIDGSVGVGQLLVYVPFDAAVRVDAHVSVGNVSIFGEDQSGVDVTVEREEPGVGGADFELELETGIGEVRLERR
jgi:hypothetical protein